MLIHLLHSLEMKERDKVIESLSNPRQSKTADDMKWILGLMKEKGSLDYARKVASRHSAIAMKQFDEIALRQSHARPRIYSQIRNLLEYLTTRDY